MSALFVELYVQLRVDSEKIRAAQPTNPVIVHKAIPEGPAVFAHRRAQNRVIGFE